MFGHVATVAGRSSDRQAGCQQTEGLKTPCCIIVMAYGTQQFINSDLSLTLTVVGSWEEIAIQPRHGEISFASLITKVINQ